MTDILSAAPQAFASQAAAPQAFASGHDSADAVRDDAHLLPALWKILLVDDDAPTHQISQIALRQIIFRGRGVHLISAYSAAEARNILAATPDVAVILLDVIMEYDRAGLDLVRQIRQELGQTQVRIVLRSGEPNLSLLQILENYDVTDFVNKSEMNYQNLHHTVIATLHGYFEMVLWHENMRLQQVLRTQNLQAEFQTRIARELRQAQYLQRAILPSDDHIARMSHHYGLNIQAHFEPAAELAGDYWGVHPIDADHVAVILLDVTGHGVGAALANFFLFSHYTHWVAQGVTNPAAILSHMNQAFYQAMKLGSFASGFLLIYDRSTGNFCWSAAASPAALYLGQRKGLGQAGAWLTGDGELLGVRTEANFDVHHGHLQPQDRILLYSDGLLETRPNLARAAATGQDHAARNLLSLAQAWHQSDQPDLSDLVAQALAGETRPLRDDLTVVVLARR
ncbi:MAG: fused response regulator/phosphatase [Candidatus Symbiobacter sp.]|nr:fused response regulator/phosphatase [Candidatus Symbiobacter sp.]